MAQMRYEPRPQEFGAAADPVLQGSPRDPGVIGGDDGAPVVAEDDDVRARRIRRRLLIAGGAIVALLAALVFLLNHGGANTDFAPQDVAQSVTVISPGRSSVAGTITATGTLAARRPMPVGVVGEGGNVVSIPVEAGDWVRQGQVLAVIDRSVQTEQARSLQAQIDVAQADLRLAQSNLERANLLVDRGFISQANIDQLTATRDASRAQVRVAQAQYREAQARNARLNIVAPAAGLVLARNVELGQVVSGGAEALFTIARGGEMEVLARLGEGELAQMRAGVPAEVSPVGTQERFTGQVWQVSPIIDQTNRQGTARIALDYDEALRPGGFATVRINAGALVAPLLPESAIQTAPDGSSFVYVVGRDDKVARRPVRLGTVTGQGIAIAEGLDGSERIVLRAGGFLSEGDTVRPVLQRPAAPRPAAAPQPAS
ncbi:efflux RND transporter periplasmic adaptor subunit [Croceibacterium mercuriale]|uniref:efflux RND transporter periplasmic adaptor subunit n=1 Tax=Croceibacterium mercuriale TaxID=1572751 RepID=UPI000B2D478B|nr:efflux RND transporter periplasmic adaptor subunit [Croceibacterium mercuriale]